MKKKLLTASTLLAVLLVAGCGTKVKLKDGKEVIASITDKEITAEELFDTLKEKYGSDALIKIIDELKTNFDDAVILLIGEENGNYPVTCALTKEAIASGLKSGVIVKSVANLLLGSGGGRPDLATGAGKDLSKLS